MLEIVWLCCHFPVSLIHFSAHPLRVLILLCFCYNEEVQHFAKVGKISRFKRYTFMNKKGLVEAVMKATGMETKAAAERSVEAVFDTIVKTMSRGEEVAIAGFGTFRVAKRAAREGRNPKTGEKIQIKASVKPKFRAGKLLKEAVL